MSKLQYLSKYFSKLKQLTRALVRKVLSTKLTILYISIAFSTLTFASRPSKDSILNAFNQPKTKFEEKVFLAIELSKRYVKSNPDSCLYYLNFAEKHINKEKNLDTWFSFQLSKGQYFGIRGEIKEADLYFSKAKSQIPKVKNQLLVADLYNVISELKRRTGEVDSSNYYANIGLALVEIHGIGTYEHVALLGLKGIATAIYGNHTQAIAYFEKGLEYATNNGHNRQIALMCTNLGTNYTHMGMQEKALQFYLRSMDAAKKLNDVNLLGLNYNNIGMQYFRIDDKNFAKQYLFKAKKIFEEAEDLFNLADVLLNIGNLYGSDKIYDSSFYYFENAISIYKQIGDVNGQATVLSNMGQAKYLSGNISESKEIFQESLDLHLSINDSSGALYPYVKIAKIELDNKNFREAINIGTIAYKLGRNRKIYSELIYLYPIPINAHKALNNNEKALFFAEEFLEIKDSVFNLQNQKESSYKLAEFEYLQKEKNLEAAQLKKDLLANQKIVEQRFLLYTILVALTGLAFIIFLLLKQNKNKKLAMKELEIKNKAIEDYSAKLLAINDVKDRLFSIIAHDLRSPLASTHSILQLLKSGQINQNDFLKISGDLAENIKHTTEITENLLSWAKSQLKGIESDPIDYNIFNACERQIKLLLENKNYQYIVISNEIDKDLNCFVDPNLTDIIFRNLISNSLKFSNNNSSIVINNRTIGDRCFISISDSGIGMDNDQLEKIKGRISFTSEGERNEKGTGLGLLICNDFIELMGGKLEVESTLGVGTTFTFDLPPSINKPISNWSN